MRSSSLIEHTQCNDHVSAVTLFSQQTTMKGHCDEATETLNKKFPQPQVYSIWLKMTSFWPLSDQWLKHQLQHCYCHTVTRCAGSRRGAVWGRVWGQHVQGCPSDTCRWPGRAGFQKSQRTLHPIPNRCLTQPIPRGYYIGVLLNPFQYPQWWVVKWGKQSICRSMLNQPSKRLLVILTKKSRDESAAATTAKSATRGCRCNDSAPRL